MNQAQKMSRVGRAGGGTPIDPESLARKSFDTAFRGFDPEQVRTYLAAAGDALRSARERVYALETALADMEKRSRAAEAELKRRAAEVPQVVDVPMPSLAELESGELAKLVGDETARVIETARGAASEIVERAHAEREEIVVDAEKLATDLAAAAEATLAERREGIAAEVAELLARAEARAEEITDDAVAEATAVADRTRLEALDLIDEAKALRRRLLEDLARRRHQARGQLELLQAGHDRLLESFAAVREAIEPAASLAGVMLTEAKAAAEQARRRVETSGPVSVDELEELLGEVQRSGRRVSTIGTEETAEEHAGDHAEVESAEEVEDAETDETDETDETAEETAERIQANAADEIPIAPPPVEGRHSSSVRVFRRGELEADAEARDEELHDDDEEEEEVVTSLFARIRADREEMDTYVRPEPGAGEGADADTDTEVDAEPVTAEVLEQREAAMAGPRRGLSRALKRVLADEQNQVLEAVSGSGEVPPLEEVLPDPDDQAARYSDAARADLRDAAYAGAHLLGSPPEGAERPVVDDLASGLGEVLVAPLRERMRSCWEEAGDNEVELLELLRGTYRQWKNRVIDRAAAGLVVEAFNRGLTVSQGERAKVWLAPVPSSN